jgi:hypothetical protein
MVFFRVHLYPTKDSSESTGHQHHTLIRYFFCTIAYLTLTLYLNVRGSCSQSYPPHHQVRSQLCYSITKILISSACFKSHLIFISPVITCSGPDAQCHRSIHACTTLPAELQHGNQTVSYTNSRKNESVRDMPVATKTSRNRLHINTAART